jgi:glyoxylase-like metal-dependent hydrolase (beta-lactamase superfamily II)
MEQVAARSTSGLPHRMRAAAALEYPFEPPAPDGSMAEVAPGIGWIRMPMPIPLDHINVYLLRDEDGWVVVDTGLNTSEAKALWEHVVRDRLDGLPIKAVLCTHFHYDHAGLAHWLTERFQVPLYMTYGEYYMMRSSYLPLPDTPGQTQTEFLARAGIAANDIEQLHDSLRRDPFLPSSSPPFRRLRDHQVLKIGARNWRVVIGAGHSPEHACLYCEEERILISGDQLLPGISSNVQVTSAEPEGDPLQQWFDSLDRLDALAPDTLILPSHQRVFRGLRERVQALRDHHAEQLDQLCDFIQGNGASTTLAAMHTLFPRLRGPVDRFLALGETVAHLSWLRFNQRLRRTLDDQGVYQFEVAGAGASASGTPPMGGVKDEQNTGIRCG